MTAAHVYDLDEVAVDRATRGDRTLHLSPDETRAAWQHLEAQGMTSGAIATTLGVTRRSVVRWRAGWPVGERRPTVQPYRWTPRIEARDVTITARMGQVLDGLIAGQTSRQIADTLGVQPRTVDCHVTRLSRRLGATDRLQVVAIACAPGVTINVRDKA